MKLAEQVTVDGNRLVVKQTHDWNPTLNAAKALRLNAKTDFGESKLAALVPMKLWHEWAKSAGVRPDDHEAMADVVARNLNDPDYAHLRVWEGKF